MRWWPWSGRSKRSVGGESGGTSAPDVRADANAALALGAVYSATSFIAGTISTLPAHLMVDTDAGKRRAAAHPLYRLMRIGPNRVMTAADFFCAIGMSLLLRGNAYVRIIRGEAGQVVAAWLLPTDRTRQKVTDRGEVVYECGQVTFHADEIWHVKGLTLDGFSGLSVISYAASVMNAGLSSQLAAERIGRNLAGPSGILKVPPKTSKEEIKEARDRWQAAHGGKKLGTVAVLPQGYEFTPLDIKAQDAEFIRARQLNREDIAALFRVPVWVVGGAEPSGAPEERGIALVTYTLLPWIVRIEQAFRKDVLLESEQLHYSLRFNVDGLMRASTLARMQAHAFAIQAGVKSPNEAREIEELAPRPGGDVYLEPLNMARVRATSDGGAILEYTGPNDPTPVVIEEPANGNEDDAA